MCMNELTACCVFIWSRVEKANAQVITRSRTGNLPPAKQILDGGDVASKVAVSGKASVEEIKEKMEQQLRLQRAAHQQKRAMEIKNTPGQVIKMVGNAAQRKFLFDCVRNKCSDTLKKLYLAMILCWTYIFLSYIRH